MPQWRVPISKLLLFVAIVIVYYWCHTNNYFFNRWDEFGPVWNNTNYITSTYGTLCYDQCATRGYKYYWCHTRKGWDYCSPRPNVDYQNNPCEATHPCTKHDKSHYWCNLEKGGSGYCGLQTPKTLFFRSLTYAKLCGDNCEYYSNKDYFYCYTSKGYWDFCSPWPNVTYRGVPCRDDHSCDLHRKSYYWCYTDEDNSWDYCGLVEGIECQYSHRLRTKRQVRQDLYQCTDSANRRLVTFVRNTAANIAILVGKQFVREIQRIISMWSNDRLTTRSTSRLRETDTFRIDMQHMVKLGNQRYYNLQIQRNVQRQNGESTTYSQVLVPENLEGVPTRYVRRAFVLSYKNRAGITIRVSPLLPRGQ